MIAPLRAPAEHWRLVEATRNTGIIRALRKADASRIRPESLPLIVGAAAGPNLEIMSRTYPPDLFAAGYHRGHMAGRLLMFVLSCAEHEPASASLTHAYKIFGEAFVFARLKGGSRAYLAKAWSDYGPVSHLWVTQELWGRRPDGGKDFSEFLGHAESLGDLAKATGRRSRRRS